MGKYLPLSKYICFYTNQCRLSLGPVWAAFLSRDATLRRKATSSFQRTVLLQHLHLCLIFVQYLSIYLIYYIQPWAQAEAYKDVFFLSV